MTTDHHGQPRLGVEVPLAGMADDMLKLRQVKTSQFCSVLKILSPDDIRHMTSPYCYVSPPSARRFRSRRRRSICGERRRAWRSEPVAKRRASERKSVAACGVEL